MSFYRNRILPYLVHALMRQETFVPYRRRIVSAAEGRVLEIGVGSGLNLALYGDRVTEVVGIDPSPRLLSMARDAIPAASVHVELIEGSGERIPLESHSIDTIVTTWTLCTIPNVTAALQEMRRVLIPSGRLLFVEHGRATEPRIVRWQDRLTPLWKRIGGGCHLNRPIATLIQEADFQLERLETGYMEGPKPMTFMYEGIARANT